MNESTRKDLLPTDVNVEPRPMSPHELMEAAWYGKTLPEDETTADQLADKKSDSSKRRSEINSTSSLIGSLDEGWYGKQTGPKPPKATDKNIQEVLDFLFSLQPTFLIHRIHNLLTLLTAPPYNETNDENNLEKRKITLFLEQIIADLKKTNDTQIAWLQLLRFLHQELSYLKVLDLEQKLPPFKSAIQKFTDGLFSTIKITESADETGALAYDPQKLKDPQSLITFKTFFNSKFFYSQLINPETFSKNIKPWLENKNEKVGTPLTETPYFLTLRAHYRTDKVYGYLSSENAQDLQTLYDETITTLHKELKKDDGFNSAQIAEAQVRFLARVRNLSNPVLPGKESQAQTKLQESINDSAHASKDANLAHRSSLHILLTKQFHSLRGYTSPFPYKKYLGLQGDDRVQQDNAEIAEFQNLIAELEEQYNGPANSGDPLRTPKPLKISEKKISYDFILKLAGFYPKCKNYWLNNHLLTFIDGLLKFPVLQFKGLMSNPQSLFDFDELLDILEVIPSKCSNYQEFVEYLFNRQNDLDTKQIERLIKVLIDNEIANNKPDGHIRVLFSTFTTKFINDPIETEILTHKETHDDFIKNKYPTTHRGTFKPIKSKNYIALTEHQSLSDWEKTIKNPHQSHPLTSTTPESVVPNENQGQKTSTAKKSAFEIPTEEQIKKDLKKTEVYNTIKKELGKQLRAYEIASTKLFTLNPSKENLAMNALTGANFIMKFAPTPISAVPVGTVLSTVAQTAEERFVRYKEAGNIADLFLDNAALDFLADLVARVIVGSYDGAIALLQPGEKGTLFFAKQAVEKLIDLAKEGEIHPHPDSREVARRLFLHLLAPQTRYFAVSTAKDNLKDLVKYKIHDIKNNLLDLDDILAHPTTPGLHLLLEKELSLADRVIATEKIVKEQQAKIVQLQKDLAVVQQANSELKQALARQDQSITQLRDALAEQNPGTQLEKLLKHQKQQEEVIKQLCDNLSQQNQENGELRRQLELQRKEIEQLKQGQEQLKQQLVNVETQLKLEQQQNKTLEQENSVLNNRLDKVETAQAATQADVQALLKAIKQQQRTSNQPINHSYHPPISPAMDIQQPGRRYRNDEDIMPRSLFRDEEDIEPTSLSLRDDEDALPISLSRDENSIVVSQSDSNEQSTMVDLSNYAGDTNGKIGHYSYKSGKINNNPNYLKTSTIQSDEQTTASVRSQQSAVGASTGSIGVSIDVRYSWKKQTTILDPMHPESANRYLGHTFSHSSLTPVRKSVKQEIVDENSPAYTNAQQVIRQNH